MNNRSATSRFFLGVGLVARIDERRDRDTLPLFPLALILEADGALASGARHLVSDEAAYLSRCRRLIESISLDLGVV